MEEDILCRLSTSVEAVVEVGDVNIESCSVAG